MHLRNEVPKRRMTRKEVENPFSGARKTVMGEQTREHYIYPFLPGVRFFKLLALRDPKGKLKDFLKLKINIVDTLVFNEKDMPLFLLSTDKEGFLSRRDIDRNQDLIKLFKEKPCFNSLGNEGDTADLRKECQVSQRRGQNLLSKSKKRQLISNFKAKSRMIGNLMISFGKVRKTKKHKGFEDTWKIIGREKLRRQKFEKEPFILLKRGANEQGRTCNSSTLFTEKEFFDKCFGLMNSRDEMFMVQKYVRGNGSLHSIVRACYSVEQGKSICFLMSNKDKMEVASSQSRMKSKKESKIVVAGKDTYILNKKRCQLQRLKHGKHFEEAMSQTREVVKFLERSMATRFTQIICEFIRGYDQRLFLFNVKAFRVESPLTETRMKAKITHRGNSRLHLQSYQKSIC